MYKNLKELTKLFSIQKLELWTIMISISLGLFIDNLIFNISNTNLTKFTDRAIGIGIMNGIDPSLRQTIYMKLIFIFISVFFINLYIFTFFNNIFKIHIKNLYIKIEKQIYLLMATFSIFTIMLYLLSRQKLYINLTIILYYLMFLTISTITIKTLFHKIYKTNFLKLFPGYQIIFFSILVPLVIFFIHWVLFNGNFTFTYSHFFWHFTLWILFWAIYYTIIKIFHNKTSKLKIEKAIILSGIPLILIPVSIPLANELQFTLSNTVNLLPRTISLIIILLLVVISLILLFTYKNIRLKNTSSFLINNLYIPIAISTIFVFKYYTQYLTFSNFDLLHTGEWVVPTQQLFQFGKMPFVDIWPAHGLSDMFPETIYSLINGYRGLEVLLWTWLPDMLGIIVIYLLLNKLFPHTFSLLLIILLPIESLFQNCRCSHLSITPALFLYWMLKKDSFIRFAFFWLSILLVSLWNPAYGAGVLPSAIFILIGYNCIRWKKSTLKKTILSFILVMVPAILAYILLLLIKNNSILETITLIIQFIKNDTIVSGYPSIIKEYSSLAILQYVIFPLTSIAYITFFIIKVIKRKPFELKNYLLIFIAFISLLFSSRTLARHSLVEGYTPSFFIFLIFYLPLLISGKNYKIYFQIIFLSLFFNYIMIFPNYSTIIKDNTLFEFRHWINKENRVTITDDSQYKDLKSFFNQHLKINQTFYEFITAPFLYAFTEREAPNNFFLPTMFYAAEPPQIYYIKKLNELYKNNRVPFVIFHDSIWWGSTTDGIPTEFRSYLITEYIYNHYKPLGNINSYQIWAANNLDKSIFTKTDKSIIHLTCKNKEKIESNNIIKLKNEHEILSFKSEAYNPYIYNFLELNNIKPLDSNNYWYLKLKYRTSVSGNVNIRFIFNNYLNQSNYSLPVSINNSHKFIELLMPITLTDKTKNLLTDIRLEPPANAFFEIQDIELLEGNYNLIPLNTIQQDFNLLKLPYIWGTYDTKQAFTKTSILEEIVNKSTNISPNTPFNVKFNPNFDKSYGNYLHIRLKSNVSGNITLSYGNNAKNGITFDIIPSDKVENYLIRISSQWIWMNEPIDSLTLTSTIPVDIQQILIRKGD